MSIKIKSRMIDFDIYRFESVNELDGFLEKIPSRLDALAKSLSDWDGNSYSFKKIAGSYPPFMLTYDHIRILENWMLDVSRDTKELTREQVMQICSLLGEITIAKSSGKWELNDDELNARGFENECRLIPSVYGWGDSRHDLPFTPLFTIEHFLRTKEASYIEMSVRYHTEEGDARFEILGEIGDAEIEVIEEYLSDLIGDGEDGLDQAMEFIHMELDYFAELLEEYDIELNLERNELDHFVDRTLFLKKKAAAIESFYRENYNGVDGAYPEELKSMMSAYVAELFATRFDGYPDYIDSELVAVWSYGKDKVVTIIVKDVLSQIENGGENVLANLVDKHLMDKKNG